VGTEPWRHRETEFRDHKPNHVMPSFCGPDGRRGSDTHDKLPKERTAFLFSWDCQSGRLGPACLKRPAMIANHK
jgi:hypothetical protein